MLAQMVSRGQTWVGLQTQKAMAWRKDRGLGTLATIIALILVHCTNVD